MKKIALMAATLATANFAFAEDVVVTEEAAPAYENAFDTFYFGLGMGGSFVKYDGSVDIKGNNSVKLNKRCNRFIGSAVIGAGKTFRQNFYVGAEFLMDFTKSKTKEITSDIKIGNDNGKATANCKYQGFTPQFDVRFGYVNPSLNALFYGKAGIVYNKYKGTLDYKAGDDAANKGSLEISGHKMGFVLGLGAEKMFCKKFSGRLEGDYNFGGKKDGIKFNKGFTIRALVAYNIKY